MDPNDLTQETIPDFAAILRRHVADPANGRAFGQLVEQWQGMVYHSSFRRSGDSTIAEDVVQKVFTILARKARAVSRHSSPLSWLFQTTKLETLHAMRSARRRQRKHDALSEAELNEPSSSNQMTDLKSVLDQALDKISVADRELVLLKYYEGRTYAEICAITGRSESANKMRIKRALEKLNECLKGEGVTLSAAAIGPAILGELTKASPLAASKIAGASLSGASSIVTSNLISNTLSTMSTAKTISTATAIVAVLATIPYVIQMSTARGLDLEITSLSSQLKVAEAVPSPLATSPASLRARRSIRSIIHGSGEAFAAEKFIADVARAYQSRDTFQILMVIVPIGQMSQFDLAEAIAAVRETDGSPYDKSVALSMLSQLVTAEGDIPELLEQYLSDGAISPEEEYSSVMQSWASKDPAAALAWLRARQEDGSLLPKGMGGSPESSLYSGFLAGLVTTDPEQALQIFKGLNSEVQRATVPQFGFALYQEGPDKVIALLRKTADQDTQALLIAATLHNYANEHSADEALAWLATANIEGAPLRDAKVDLASNQSLFGKQGIESQIDWLVRNAGDEELSDYTRPFAVNVYTPKSWST